MTTKALPGIFKLCKALNNKRQYKVLYSAYYKVTGIKNNIL